MVVRAANIGPKGRRRRALMGVLTLAAGIAALVVLLLSGVGRGWRGALFLPFWAGALGVFQARGHTRVRLAARGRRDPGGGGDLVAGPGMVTPLKPPGRGDPLESARRGAGPT